MADSDTKVIPRSGLSALSVGKEAQDMADELIRGAVVSLKTPIDVPEHTSVDMSGIFSAMDRFTAQSEVANANIGVERDRFGDAIKKKQEGLDSKAAAEGDFLKAEQARAQSVGDMYVQIGKTMGIDPNIEAANLASHIADLRPGVEAQLQEIQQMQTPSDPLEWIANQFILPTKISAYNTAATRLNAAQNTLDDSIKTAKDLAEFSVKGIPTITAGEAVAKGKLALANATIFKAEAEELLARSNVAFAKEKLAIDLAIVTQTENMTQLQQRENQLKFANAIQAINLADTHAKRQLEAAKLLEMLEDKNALKILIANYERTMGHPTGTFSLAVFKSLPKDKQDNIVAIGAGSFGADPFTATVNFWASKPGMNISPEYLNMQKYLKENAETIAISLKTQNIDEKQKPAVIATALRNKINDDVNNIGNQRAGNPFNEMTPAIMISSGAIPANTRLAQILESYTAKSGQVPTRMILETIKKEVKDIEEQAALISGYYRKNIELRNSILNTSTIGVKLPTEYVIKEGLFDNSFFAGKFDLTKPEEVKKLLLFQKQRGTIDGRQIGIGGVGGTGVR